MSLPIIPTESIQTGEFNRLWVRSINITPTSMYAALVPYDGLGNILQTPVSICSVPDVSKEPELAAIIDAIVTYTKNKAQQTIAPKIINAQCNDPRGKSRIVTLFKTDDASNYQSYIIPDLFALAETDQSFGLIIVQTLTWIANKMAHP